MSGNKL